MILYKLIITEQFILPPFDFQLWEGYEDFYYIAQVLAFSNSAINPLLYAGFNDNFRKGTILSILQITE